MPKNPKPLANGRLRAWEREKNKPKQEIADRSDVITRQQVRQMQRKAAKQ